MTDWLQLCAEVIGAVVFTGFVLEGVLGILERNQARRARGPGC